MQLVLTALAPDVRPADALAWWWDFEDGKTDHAFLWIRTRRRVLARAPARVEAEERAPFFRERWTAWRETDAVRFAGRNSVSTFEGRYRFAAAEGGTRIELAATVTLRAWLRWATWIAAPIARWILGVDLRGHARELTRAR